MGNAALTQLPQNIGNLTRLRRLGLKSCGLTQLPDSFTRLASLVELFVTDNRLEALPEGAGFCFWWAVCEAVVVLVAFLKERAAPQQRSPLNAHNQHYRTKNNRTKKALARSRASSSCRPRSTP